MTEVAVSTIFDQLSVEDIVGLIHCQIDKFFNGKEMYCGGYIPQKALHSDYNINLIIDTELLDAIDKAHVMISGDSNLENSEDDEDENLIEDSTRLILDSLAEMAKSGVSKEFSGGMLLLYLKFCEGFDE